MRLPGSRAAALAILPALAAAAVAPAGGAEEDEASSRPGAAAAIGGDVLLRPIFYREEAPPEAALGLRGHLSCESRLSARWLVRARGRLDADARGDVDRRTVHDADDRDLRRALLNFEELSLTFRTRRLDLDAGRLTIPWGRADGFNPTDNLTPFDALDPLDPERISSWALRGRAYAGRATFEADVLPWPGVSRLPQLDARWFPLPDRAANPSYPGSGPRVVTLDWGYRDRFLAHRGVENAAWALKADWRGSSFEGSVSHYDGWDDQPVILGMVQPPPPGRLVVPVLLFQHQPTLRATGGDLAWVMGRFVLRAEGAHHRRGWPRRDGFDFYVVEGEATRGDWRVIAGWAGVRGAEASSTTSFSFEQGALPAGILRLERSVPTGTGASVQVLSNLDGDGRLVRLEVSWPAGDAWRLGAGADLLTGPEGSFLGRFRGNDRLAAAARWSF